MMVVDVLHTKFPQKLAEKLAVSNKQRQLAATCGNVVKMRGAHAMFRVVMWMHVDGVASQYELTFRVYGADRAVSIKRLEKKQHDPMQIDLPFDPVAVELQSYPNEIVMDATPGNYMARMAFLKRDRSGAIVATVPVVWVLSPISGVYGELAPGAQSFLSPFVATVHGALLSLVSWNAGVERPRINPALQSGSFTFEGYVKSTGRRWARLRIQVELLLDGTLSGTCIGESLRTSVSGFWTPSSFDMSMDFRRSETDPTTRLRLCGDCSSGYRFSKIAGDDQLSRFNLEIVKLGQGCVTVSQAVPPFDFYLEARLAVLSSFKAGSAPSLLTSTLWRRIFAFYDASWFVRVKPLKKIGSPRRPAWHEASPPVSKTVGSSETLTTILAKPREDPIEQSQSFSQTTWASAAIMVHQHWATLVYLVIALAAIMWSSNFALSDFNHCGANTGLTDCVMSPSPNASNAYDASSQNGTSPSTGIPSSRSITASKHRVDHPYWLLLVMVFVTNCGLVLLPRVHPPLLFSALVVTGFLYSRLRVHRLDVSFAGAFAELCSEVAILLATVGWVYASSCARTFASWESLQTQSRLVFWGSHYVLPFFIAVNINSIVSVFRLMAAMLLNWPDVRISSYTGLLAVTTTSVAIGEVFKSAIPHLLRLLRTNSAYHDARIRILLAATTSILVFSPRIGMLSIAFLPLTSHQTNFAAATQALLLGVFVQGFASHLNQLQGHV